MSTEVLKIENANLVRLELKNDKGETTAWKDLAWPTTGDLLLNDGEGGIVASGPLVEGLRPWARFTGKGLKVTQVQVSTRPTDPAATDPSKMDRVTVSSFTA